MAGSAPPRRPTHPWQRRAGAIGVVTVVLLAHAMLARQIVEAWPQPAEAGPARLNVAFVRTLQPQAPVPVVAAPAAVPARPRAPTPATPAPAPERPASAPSDTPPAGTPPPHEAPAVTTKPTAPDPEPEPATVAQTGPEPPVANPATPEAPPAPVPEAVPSDGAPPTLLSPSGGPAPADPAASAVAFTWPPSTRMSYMLTGHYRGPIDGSAQVLWLREGARYQVHLDVHVGPPFAAIIERQMSSDGRLGPEGLVPRRYDERTHVAFREPRALTMAFEADTVQLAGGRRVPRPPGVQDTVSQFVQLTWRFTLQPALLTPGTVIEMPLALPRRVETWVYDVGAAETLWTPAGAVEAVHVKPRREPRPGGDLVAEMWFAPTLQYLPVRIVIRPDAETWIDLMVSRLPEQAVDAPVAGPAPAPAVPSAPSPDTTPRRP